MLKEYKNNHPLIFKLVIWFLIISTISVLAGTLSGPNTVTLNAIPRYENTKGLKNSGVLVDNSDNMTGLNNLTAVQGNVTTVYATNVYLIKASVSLIADNQVITATDSSAFLISSDNGTASSRTFLLTTGIDGKKIYLIWSGTNAGEIVDDAANSGSGNIRLSSTWTPTQYDVLVLIGIGTDWYEVSRSAN